MPRWIIVVALFALPSCAGAPGIWAAVLTLVTALFLAACGESTTTALGGGDASEDGGVRLDVSVGPLDLGPTDTRRPDMGDGTWEPCCADGIIETCFCPAGVACNYGQFMDCGDGTCAPIFEMCER